MKTKLPSRIKSRKTYLHLEDIPISPSLAKEVTEIAQSLAKQIELEEAGKKYARTKEILTLVGAGAFVAASFALPTLPMALKPFLVKPNAPEPWERFNIPYLKRTLKRLAQEKLVDVSEAEGLQQVIITDRGQRRILRYALDTLAINKPKSWDGTWRLVSYDVPKHLRHLRNVFREYLRAWGFYPLHESVFLHAYPCTREVTFLREYLGIGEFVRIFAVSRIENDRLFRDFFGV